MASAESSQQFVKVLSDGFSGMVINGSLRKLTLRPPKFKPMARLMDSMDLIPESDWTATHLRESLGKDRIRLDQGAIGECEPTAEVEAIMALRAIAGLAPIKLSASFLYAHINGGVDQGASIGDGYSVLREFGCCSDSLCPTGQFYVRGQLSQKMFTDARNYRAILAYHCPSFPEMVTARLKGYMIVHGVCVGGSFNNLDSDTCYPVTRGMPNHAVWGMDFGFRSNGEPMFKDSNHWGTKWGDDGDFGTSREAYEVLGYQDAIAYESVSVDSDTLIPANAVALIPVSSLR